MSAKRVLSAITCVGDEARVAKNLDEVVASTVRLAQRCGFGVLVEGGYILTAAHCITAGTISGMALGDHLIEEVETDWGKFRTSVLAVEPVADIAVLGSPDSQALGEDALRYDEFCLRMRPVALRRGRIGLLRPLPVNILAPSRTWVTGRAIVSQPGAHTVLIEADAEVVGGSSGGPIVDDTARLVGITSLFSDFQVGVGVSGVVPRPHLALPSWVCQSVSRAGRVEERYA